MTDCHRSTSNQVYIGNNETYFFVENLFPNGDIINKLRRSTSPKLSLDAEKEKGKVAQNKKSRSKQKTSLEAQSLVKNLVCININIKASPKSTCLLQIENHNARHVYKITLQKSKYHTNAQTLKISYTNINLKYHKAETKIKPSPFEKEYFFTKALNGHRKQLTYSSREFFYLGTLLF